MNIKLKVNGRAYETIVKENASLLETLRDLGFSSVKCGCNSSTCGLCTVLVNGLPKLSCSILTARCQDVEITTLEGLLEESQLLRDYLAEDGADQCGYCSSGFIVNVISLKRQKRRVSEEEIRSYLRGNLCRCTGYESQLRAVKKFLEV